MNAYAESYRPSRPAAWWGMVMFIAAEATLFGCFVGTYYFLRFTHAQWPPAGVPKPAVAIPLVMTAVLVASTIPMTLALRTRRIVLLVVALAMQAGYFAYEAHDFGDQLHRFTPQTDAYGSIYYVLLGADHAHVAIGLLLDLWLLGKLARGFNRYRANALWAITIYWYAVAAITVAVIGTLVSARA